MRLETERLLLRDWLESDIQDLILGLNNIGVSKWLAQVPHPYTESEAKHWLEYCSSLSPPAERPVGFEFAIELKGERRVIGGVTLNQINYDHGTAGGGIWINEEYQRKGYGSEAFGERIRFAFSELGLRRLENGFIAGNPGSMPMQAKFGYQLEGLRRRRFVCRADGKIKDEQLTGLLRDEWISAR